MRCHGRWFHCQVKPIAAGRTACNVIGVLKGECTVQHDLIKEYVAVPVYLFPIHVTENVVALDFIIFDKFV